MNQIKNKSILPLLKSVFIAVPIGVLLDRVLLGANSYPISIGIVWLICIGIMAKRTLLKCLFVAVPIGLILSVITGNALEGFSRIGANTTLVGCAVWLTYTAIVSIVIMWLTNKFVWKSKLDNLKIESTSQTLCSYCAEEIKPTAILCRHCKSNLDTPIQDKHVFACILLAIFIACFYVSKAIGDIASTDYSVELRNIADAVRFH